MHPHTGRLVYSQNRLVFQKHRKWALFGGVRRMVFFHNNANLHSPWDEAVDAGGFAVNKNRPLLLQPLDQGGGKGQLSA